MMELRVVGILYLLSGGWCALKPALAAGFLGLSFSSELGAAEFFSVYGGLQVGLGAALLMSSMVARYSEAAFYFSAIFSTGLLSFRLGSIVIYGAGVELISMAVLEALIAAWLWYGWQQARVSGQSR